MATDDDPKGTAADPKASGGYPIARSADPSVLLAAAKSGNRAALGRLLSFAERPGPAGREVSRLVFREGEAQHVVGLTGAPGAGKSTLTDRVIGVIRAGGTKVGVLAVDPSSPFSGGAILGDRIRMGGHALDDGVFIRSMATRGHQGGLALAAPEAIRVLASCGYPTILVETVGVGQVEVAIAGAADTTVVVVNPGWGDSVQAAKAGLLEIADIFVVNKADRPGADQVKRDLESMLDLTGTHPKRDGRKPWRPPILATKALSADGAGVDELWDAICTHRRHIAESGELEERRQRRLLDEARSALVAELMSEVDAVEQGQAYRQVSDALIRREVDPYGAAARLREAIGDQPR